MIGFFFCIIRTCCHFIKSIGKFLADRINILLAEMFIRYIVFCFVFCNICRYIF